jgi:hypothetical protein
MREGGSTAKVVPFVENEDYYLDRGLMVLTARYHLRRGYCCDQGCRHCPYTEAPKENSQTEVDSDEKIK